MPKPEKEHFQMENYRSIKNMVEKVKSKIGSKKINSGVKRIIHHNQVGLIPERKVWFYIKI